MDELEKMKVNYECLKKNYDTMCAECQREKSKNFELKSENDKLWKLVENLSVALREGR